MSEPISLAERRRQGRLLFFNRRELNLLLSLYSRRVGSGEWRDYAIDHRPGMALFSVFRHSHDQALYAIAKSLDGERKPHYRILAGGRRIKESKDLGEALAAIERQLRVVS